MAVDIGVAELTLLDWRRRISELYAEVRAGEPEPGWRRWRQERDRMFATHPQSPLGEDRRARFEGLAYHAYDPAARVHAEVRTTERRTLEIDTSTGERIRFTRFGEAVFVLLGVDCALPLYWLEGYGGGVFLPFADATNGGETYGGGRYLLDTAKGADLGPAGSGIVLDFNFAYNPSCAYSPQWTCPLPPAASRLACPVEAGERAPEIR
jgi:uncharacterized protein